MTKLAALLGIGAIAGGMLAGLATPASAHRTAQEGAGPEGGIVVPNLSHGQMRVIADNRDAIMDLAARQVPTDPTMRRLEGFIAIQRFACLWGIVPGSVADEGSPFNECAHAYLAGARALLVHLQGMPGDRTETRALVTKVELEMLDHDASLVLCRYSDEPFDTAAIIGPRWRDIPSHGPTSMAFGGTVLAVLGCAWFARGRAGPPRTPDEEPRRA